MGGADKNMFMLKLTNILKNRLQRFQKNIFT